MDLYSSGWLDMDLLSRFVMLNHRLSLAIEARLPKAFNQNLNRLCILKVADLLNSRRGQIVLDVGGGKECPFLGAGLHLSQRSQFRGPAHTAL